MTVITYAEATPSRSDYNYGVMVVVLGFSCTPLVPLIQHVGVQLSCYVYGCSLQIVLLS